jgi:mannan endo-1,4-beta-mannosidase
VVCCGRVVAHKCVALLCAGVLGCSELVINTTAKTDAGSYPAGGLSATFFVSGCSLFDPCGQPVVLRGVNEMITFSEGKDGAPEYTEIAKTHANAVRVTWHTTDTAAQLDTMLCNAEAQRLIPIVAAYNPQVATSLISMVADYWSRSDVAAIAQKHQQWLIISAGGPSVAATESAADWSLGCDQAVARIRAASIRVPIAIEIPDGGRDMAAACRLGLQRIAADPVHNLLIGVNSWWSDGTVTNISDQLTATYNTNLTVLVSEFSAYAASNCPNMPFDYLTLMSVTQPLGIGWFAWSWGAVHNANCNVNGVAYLDMTTDGTYAGLVGWGYDVAVGDSNSIERTAVAPAFVPGGSCP